MQIVMKITQVNLKKLLKLIVHHRALLEKSTGNLVLFYQL